MLTKDRYLNLNILKVRCFILIVIVFSILVFQNTWMILNIDGKTFNYIIKPFLWMALTSIIYTFPKVRSKAKLKYKKSFTLWSFNAALIYIIILIGAGIIDGYGKSPYSHSIKGLIINIIFIGSFIIGREILRNYLVNGLTKEENYFIFILISLLLTFTNISMNQIMNLNGLMDLVEYMAQNFLPEFCNNLLATFMTFIGGPLTSIIYFSIIYGFEWLSPILPDLKWITKALIGIILPVFFLISLQNKYYITCKKIKKRHKKTEDVFSWMVTCLISILIIWFSVGVFPIYPSVIATGSMEPAIKPGDVIIVKKSKTDKILEGDIIQFKRDTILISHRIVGIHKNEKQIMYKTKGDNNSTFDKELIFPEQIKGKIIYVVPKIGWLTLLIKGEEEIHLKDIVF